MHFCNKFAQVYPSEVKELGDIFLESLLAAERQDKKKAALFDTPPFKRFVPDLVTAVTSLLEEFKKGLLDEPSVLSAIHEVIK